MYIYKLFYDKVTLKLCESNSVYRMNIFTFSSPYVPFFLLLFVTL